uniref:Uncharacterized protein n=1 Tax=Molossus molossus TaxID=27622 RepID=A0A7J8JVQ0_MOLMO|nr:hypothetical protein HJG59_007877 [Molossus molossus]
MSGNERLQCLTPEFRVTYPSSGFPDSNFASLILATRRISSKYKRDHDILLKVQHGSDVNHSTELRSLNKACHGLATVCFPCDCLLHSLFWTHPGLLAVWALWASPPVRRRARCRRCPEWNALPPAVHVASSPSSFGS